MSKMITEKDKKLTEALDKGEEYWTFREDAERDYVHDLFAYPAMMVPKMQREILEEFDRVCEKVSPITVFDPFMGSGTIMVEGMLRGFNIIGVDINPLAFLVAKVKTEIYSLPRLRKSIDNLEKQLSLNNTIEVPTTFLHIDKWFKPEIRSELDIIKQQIRNEPCLKIRKFLWVVFCDTIRIVSNSRSCTYKLYIKSDRAIESFDKSPIQIYKDCLENAYNGVVEFQTKLEELGRIKMLGNRKKYSGIIDLRLADSIDECRNICDRYHPDLVITSPPYGDNETTVTYGQYSILALRWIDINDIGPNIDVNLIESQSKIDKVSLGGTYQKKLDKEYVETSKKSPTLDAQLRIIEAIDKEKTWKIKSFYHDFESIISALSSLHEGSYVIMTVGNRTVAKQRIKMNEIIKELFNYYGFDSVSEFSRRIIRKRMSAINAVDQETGALLESMNKEYVLIMKKR